VELPEGVYLADVGFGNLAPTSALCSLRRLNRKRRMS